LQCSRARCRLSRPTNNFLDPNQQDPARRSVNHLSGARCGLEFQAAKFPRLMMECSRLTAIAQSSMGLLMRFVKPRDFRSMPSATGGIARLALARMRETGKAVSAVLSGAGLVSEEVDDPTVRIPVPTQIRILNLVAQELQDDLLGFHLARNFDLREIGLLYYVMASSEQLSDALQHAERYSVINNDGVRLHNRLERTVAIALDYLSVDRSSDRHQIEFWLVALVRICRQLTDSRLAPRQLKVRHSRNGTPGEYRSFLGCDIEFGADADELVFPRPVASLRVVGADTYLNKLLRQYADEALAGRPPHRGSARADVERVIPQLLPHGHATVSAVARQLGLSSRTLSRALSAERTGFTEILEELRFALAKRYLRDRELPISEVAWLLGYREISSFTHAFKRWTGMSPRQFRLSEECLPGHPRWAR
jgi:AraC-like DNA-binding protein